MDYLRKGLSVENKEDGPWDRSLGNAGMDWSRERFGAIYRDSLVAIIEIGSEPSKDSVRYTKRVTKTLRLSTNTGGIVHFEQF